MYKALIIDDEEGARSALKELLKLFCPEVDVIREASTAAEALGIAQKYDIDLTFIDIQLRRINGIQLAKQLKPFCSNQIFVTAHDHYAIEAFQAQALHYLLKPVDPQALQDAIKRVGGSNAVSRGEGRLLLNIREGVVVLNHHEIRYIHGEGNYCTFYCRDGRSYLVSKHLSYYEELLNSKNFFRIHQSYLINLECVRQVFTQNQNSVLLKNEERLPVARRRKEAFLRALG